MAVKIKIEIISEVTDQVLGVVHPGLLTEGKTDINLRVQQGRKQDHYQDHPVYIRTGVTDVDN